jgi:hypothetical protein
MPREIRERLGAIARSPAPESRRPASGPAGAADRVSIDDGNWSTVLPPFERFGHTAIVDAARDRMIVFGGVDGDSLRNDVWILSLGGGTSWSGAIPAGNAPPARFGHTAVLDAARDRMIVFGGMGDAGPLGDVWTLSLSGGMTWNAVVTSGGPSPRSGHAAVLDSLRERMLVIGGADADSVRSDVWALTFGDSATWSAVATTGSFPPRSRHTASRDPVRDRILVFGGSDGTGELGDVQALSLADAAWTPVSPTGTPAARSSHTAAYDPVGDALIVSGGSDGTFPLNDTWALPLGSSPVWSQVFTVASPPGRHSHTLVRDPSRDRFVSFGGTDDFYRLNDVWSLTITGAASWSKLSPSGAPPSSRFGHTAMLDPVRSRMVMFAGLDGGGYVNDVWSMSLSGNVAWSAIAASGTAPSPRYSHSSIYDPLRDRMIVYGGAGSGGYPGDVWALSFAPPAWSSIAAAGPPVPRIGHSAIYEPAGDRMIVFGGYDGVTTRNDVWELTLGPTPTWTQLSPIGSPPPTRYLHSAVYDTTGDRMIVFGGSDGASPLSDTWALSLGATPAWTEITAAGSPPSARYLHSAVYDPARDRMIVVGGYASTGPIMDVRALGFAGGPAWSTLVPGGTAPSARYLHSMILDAARDRGILFGGTDTRSPRNDAPAVVWTAPVSAPRRETLAARVALARPRPNPMHSRTEIAFEIARPGRVTLRVVDAAGRTVRRIADEWLAAGSHRRAWNGEDDLGRPLSSGVYFVCLESDGERASRRAILVR